MCSQQHSSGTQLPICPICGKACPAEDCVKDVQGRTLRRACYRKAIIEGQESL
jgi:hypothetical protein